MLLEDSVAVIYGTGPIGAAVARGFAREGARVFVANRTKAKADALAEWHQEIEERGRSHPQSRK